MKAVLMSIQPKWCQLIASGRKTIEIRKSKPKLDVPFKVYIYCTANKQGVKDLLEIHGTDGKIHKANSIPHQRRSRKGTNGVTEMKILTKKKINSIIKKLVAIQIIVIYGDIRRDAEDFSKIIEHLDDVTADIGGAEALFESNIMLINYGSKKRQAEDELQKEAPKSETHYENSQIYNRFVKGD